VRSTDETDQEPAPIVVQPADGEELRASSDGSSPSPPQSDEEASTGPKETVPATPKPVRRRPKRWTLVAIVAGSLTVLAAAGWGLTYSPLFRAKTIRVEGARHLGQRQVLRLAEITPGVNVLHFDAGAAERRLESSPWVASADVRAELPSTLLVSITEQVPVAVIRGSTGGSELVAGDGVIISATSGGQALPEIEGANVSSVPSPITLEEGATAAAAMTPQVRSATKAIIVGDDGSILVLLRSGVAVSYGAAANLAAKDQALQAVLSWAERNGQNLVAIDVSVPSAPTATLAGGVTARPRGSLQ
jgi:cell division protein FtsQ